MISEFERIINDESLNNYNEIDYANMQIKEAFEGTKIKDCRKWGYIQKFLKLTEGIDDSEVSEVIVTNKGSLRKKMGGFKKVNCYLSYFRKCNKDYSSLNLSCVYFQKILVDDWNEVLRKLNT